MLAKLAKLASTQPREFLWFVVMYQSDHELKERTSEATVECELWLPRCFSLGVLVNAHRGVASSFGPKYCAQLINNGILWGPQRLLWPMFSSSTAPLHAQQIQMSSRCIPLIFCGKRRAPLTGYGHVESMDQPPCEMKICIITTASQRYAVVVPPNIAKEQKKKPNIDQTVKHVLSVYPFESVATLVTAEAEALVFQTIAQLTPHL